MNPKTPISGPSTRAPARSGFTQTPALVLLLVVSFLGAGGLVRTWTVQDASIQPQAMSAQEVTGRDTVLVYGPRRFDVVRGESAFHVEEFQIPWRPGARYRVVIANGAVDGGGRADRGRFTLNDAELVSKNERLRGEETVLEGVEVRDLNQLTLELSGATGSFVM